MNRMLAASPQTATRSLEMRTYEVVPLNDKVGLIEWMSGTETLMKVIEGDETNVSKALNKAKGQYCNFIHGNYIPSYKQSRSRVEGNFAGVQAFLSRATYALHPALFSARCTYCTRPLALSLGHAFQPFHPLSGVRAARFALQRRCFA